MYSSDVEKTLADMDSHTRMCMLLDFYGQMLSDRARETLELYFAEDMSLSEIADDTGVSRQAVHERVRRAQSTLEALEAKLGLASRFGRHRQWASEALTALDADDRDTARQILLQLAEEL